MTASSDAGARQVQVTISGGVQGVGFRAWTAQQARALGLSGWVRNLPSGDVEAVFCGAPDEVAAMLAACRNGPRFAAVADVRTDEETAANQAGRFEIR